MTQWWYMWRQRWQ